MKVLHTVDVVASIDFGETRRRVVAVKGDLEEGHHKVVVEVVGSPEVVDSSPGAEHNPEEVQEERHAVVDILVVSKGAADSLAGRSLGNCKQGRAMEEMAGDLRGGGAPYGG